MKYRIIVPILFLCFFALTLKLNAQKVDSITTFNYDTASHSFTNSTQQTFNYNGGCYLVKYLYNFWDDNKNKYANYYRTTNSLLANNSISQSLSQIWDDVANKWDNYQKGIYSYLNNQINPNTIQYQQWNTNNSSWLNSKLYTYKYDANANDTSIVIQDWVAANSSWVNSDYYRYVYNGNNNILQFTQSQWNNTINAWKETMKINYLYNSQNKLLEDSGLKFNTISNVWVNQYRNTYQYDANNFLTNSQYDVWDTTSNIFIPYQQYIYTNNTNGMVAEALTLGYNGMGWDTLYKDVYHYNGCVLPIRNIYVTASHKDGNVILKWNLTETVDNGSFYVEFSENSTSNFIQIATLKTHQDLNYSYQDNITNGNIKFYRIKYVDINGNIIYSNTVNISNNRYENIVAQFYPNPTSGFFIIDVKKETKICYAQVSDILGKQLNRIALKKGINTIDISELNKGVYLISVISESGVVTKKIILN
ncbi:MAG: T9SS type A sorting domain-containing protein [Bacteroidetes bacterium]|nr:T9SS type A sorting domain-containing protein [Bacteroidota bacterium]